MAHDYEVCQREIQFIIRVILLHKILPSVNPGRLVEFNTIFLLNLMQVPNSPNPIFCT